LEVQIMSTKRAGIIFRSNGGLGKQLCATAVARQIKEKNPDIPLHVQTSYPAAFMNLKFVDKVYPMQALPDFYDNHVDFDILETEPYTDLQYRKGNQHIVDVWCRKLGVDVPTTKKPIIELKASEVEVAKRFFAGLRLGPNATVIAIQYVGGTSYYDQRQAQDPTRIKHYRDLPFDTAQDVVKKLAQKGILCVNIGLPAERQLDGVIPLPSQDGNVINPRFVFAIMAQCKGGMFIDSFAQHAWVGLGKGKAVVAWGGKSPTSLGYSENSNLIGKCDHIGCSRPDSFMFDVTGDGGPWECPYNAKCMNFKADEIVEAVIGSIEVSKPPKPEEAQK
jgi:Rieske Fe-S protein